MIDEPIFVKWHLRQLIRTKYRPLASVISNFATSSIKSVFLTPLNIGIHVYEMAYGIEEHTSKSVKYNRLNFDNAATKQAFNLLCEELKTFYEKEKTYITFLRLLDSTCSNTKFSLYGKTEIAKKYLPSWYIDTLKDFYIYGGSSGYSCELPSVVDSALQKLALKMKEEKAIQDFLS